jgi:UDP-4-keto-D-QuiNAc 4-reductase
MSTSTAEPRVAERVLVTGATGFIGRVACLSFANEGLVVRAALRPGRAAPPGASEQTIISDVLAEGEWRSALEGVQLVVHLAARAHVSTTSQEECAQATSVNARGTGAVARAAARAGIRRFIYLSSIKVTGEWTLGRAFTASDVPQPADAYARSKWQGEQEARSAGESSGMEVAIVRAPLVYGPGVRANFLQLLQWVDAGRPLPLGAVRNARSLVSVWNLADLIVRLMRHPAAPGRTFLVSDGVDLSTPELVRRLARASGRKARLMYVPLPILSALARLIGAREQLRRLCGSLTVNIDDTRALLDWSPCLPQDEGLRRTVNWYQDSRRS